MPFVTWFWRSRKRFTVGALMAAVALGSLALNALRPPSRLEAERMALRSSDPSGRWRGRFRAQARREFPDYWLVEIFDTRSGEFVYDISVSRWGWVQCVGASDDYWERH